MIYIAGGSGFVGKYLIEALLQNGHKIRCLVRTNDNADALIKKGVDAIVGDITNRDSLKGTMKDVRMAINLVGIIQETHTATYASVHLQGNLNLTDEARQSGVGHFFYQSALGADMDSWSGYRKSKASAEEVVKKSGIPYTIFRPSLIVGGDDGFIRKIKDMISSPLPLIPIPGTGKTKFQPIFIGDWVKCFLEIINNPSYLGNTYEIGGPEHLTYEDIVRILAESMGSTKPLIHVPIALLKISAPMLGLATSEQLRLLKEDNICQKNSVKMKFGFDPMTFRDSIRLFV